jgi:hypothetical protein
MSRIWIRNASLLAAVATGAAGLIGIDVASGVRTPAEGASSVSSSSSALPARGSVKVRTIENARLGEQRAEASRRAALERAERRAAAARADRSERVMSPGGARSLGRQLAAAGHGWSGAQFACLDSLWSNESAWQLHAQNSSGAYGIPQALPGTRMATAGSDWRNSASTQIRWGLDYIDARYGSPCSAWGHWRAHRWY